MLSSSARIATVRPCSLHPSMQPVRSPSATTIECWTIVGVGLDDPRTRSNRLFALAGVNRPTVHSASRGEVEVPTDASVTVRRGLAWHPHRRTVSRSRLRQQLDFEPAEVELVVIRIAPVGGCDAGHACVVPGPVALEPPTSRTVAYRVDDRDERSASLTGCFGQRAPDLLVAAANDEVRDANELVIAAADERATIRQMCTPPLATAETHSLP